MNFVSHSEYQKLVDDDQELLYTSYHEAGHVVAARHFGFRVAWVSIDPDFFNHDPLALKNALTGVMASERLTFMVPRGSARSSSERQMLTEFCIEVQCGPKAEALVNPNYWQTSAGDDFSIQQALPGFGSRSQRHLNRTLNEIERASNQFIKRHECVISKFAARLLSERTILERDIDRVIAWARGMSDRPLAMA